MQHVMKTTVLAMMMVVATTVVPTYNQGTFSIAQAEASNDFEKNITSIEDRMHMLNLVLKSLLKTFKKAKKNHHLMLKQGMDEADINQIEKAYKIKVDRMVNDAVTQINNI